MKDRMIALICGIGFLLLFTLFSYWVRHGAFRDVDFAFTVKVQEAIDKSPRLHFSRLVGEVMEGSTFLASPEVSVIFILILTGLSYMKLSSIDRRKSLVYVRTLVIPIMFLLLVLAEVYGKTVVHHPAPPFFMIKNPTTIFPKYYINEQFSYPSGHAARAIFLAFVLSSIVRQLADRTSYFKRKNVRIGSVLMLVGYVGLVSISRIYLGHHWLSDVIGGWLLGSGFGCLWVFWYTFRLGNTRKHIWNGKMTYKH